jgi:hypothetical protein
MQFSILYNIRIRITISVSVSVSVKNKSGINTSPSPKTTVFGDGLGGLDGMGNRHGMTVYEVGSMKSKVGSDVGNGN